MYNYIIDYGIIIISLFITLGAQLLITSSYSKYKKIRNKKNITGAECAREILQKNGLDEVYVVEVDGKQLVKVVAWYDNEMGYSAQMVRTAKYFSTK